MLKTAHDAGLATPLLITVLPKALINGGLKARSVVVNGKVEGPIVGQDVLLKSQAFVTGDIQAQTLLTEPGAPFRGSLVTRASRPVVALGFGIALPFSPRVRNPEAPVKRSILAGASFEAAKQLSCLSILVSAASTL